MKILIINRYFCELSAVESLAWKTFNDLKAKGHDVYFFATDRKPYYIENYEYSKYFPKNRYSTIEYLKNPLSYYWDFEAANKLEKILEVVKPDVVHVNQTITLSTIKVLKNHNIPIVWTLHDPAIACPATTMKLNNNKYCNNFLCKNHQYYNCLIHTCQNNRLEPSIRKTIRSYVNYYSGLYREVDLYITPSVALKDLIVSSNCGINEKQICVLNNFIDTKENTFEKVIDKDSYFLFVGRIVEEKGIRCLMEAIKGLPRDILYVIAGAGNLEEYVRNFIETNNLHNVKCLGYVKQDNIHKLYQSAIATIVPSNFFEIFGMINIESFINKTPVIGSNIGGIPEIVENNKNGFIFDIDNTEQLKNCILTYWNNIELAKQHGENGYKKVIENYTQDIYMRKLISIYEKLIEERKAFCEN